MQNNQKFLPVIIIAVALVISAGIISRTGIYIKNTGGVETNGKISNTISVSGDGKVYTKPDMAEIDVGFRELASTSREALDKVNTRINQVIKILKDNGIEDKDITTSNLDVYTEYDYSGSTRRIIGQRASQSLNVKIKKLDDKATKAAKIIDQVSLVDNVYINGISFDVEDKSKFFTQARELAFNKAKQKAEELAKLAGVKLQKPVTISDTTYDVAPATYLANNAKELSLSRASGGGSDSTISSGEINITANLSILWGIE